MSKRKYTKIIFQDWKLKRAVESSVSVQETVRKLGMKVGRGSGIYKAFWKKIKALDLDTSHFLGSGYLKARKRAKLPRGKTHNAWRGYEAISGESFTSYKVGAKIRGLAFTVSIKYLWKLYLDQDKKCALTGWDISFPPTSLRRTEGTASPDRIDNSKGYIKGNIQWVHKDINLLKARFGQDHLIRMCKAIAANNP